MWRSTEAALIITMVTALQPGVALGTSPHGIAPGSQSRVRHYVMTGNSLRLPQPRVLLLGATPIANRGLPNGIVPGSQPRERRKAQDSLGLHPFLQRNPCYCLSQAAQIAVYTVRFFWRLVSGQSKGGRV